MDFASPLNVVERLMVKLVGIESRNQVTASEIERFDLDCDGPLYRTAEANEVVAHIGHAMRDLGVRLPNAWQASHDASALRMANMMRELDAVADAFYDAGIPLVALKNAGIARGLYSCQACCPMGDLDVLVERRFFRQAHQILVDAGYEFEFRSPLETAELVEAESAGGSEYWKSMGDGDRLWLELQWRPIAGRWLRPEQEPSAEELMHRSVSINGSHVRLLSPEDNLLQVAVHTAKHTYVRAPGFRLHTDVDRIVAQGQIDWDRFCNTVISRELRTAVYFSLRIPSELFGTPVPKSILERLRPVGWKRAFLSRAISRAGILYPAQRKFGRISYITFNGLLYDDLGGLFRSVFPSRSWMRERHGAATGPAIIRAYCRRFFQLIFRRNRT